MSARQKQSPPIPSSPHSYEPAAPPAPCSRSTRVETGPERWVTSARLDGEGIWRVTWRASPISAWALIERLSRARRPWVVIDCGDLLGQLDGMPDPLPPSPGRCRPVLLSPPAPDSVSEMVARIAPGPTFAGAVILEPTALDGLWGRTGPRRRLWRPLGRIARAGFRVVAVSLDR